MLVYTSGHVSITRFVLLCTVIRPAWVSNDLFIMYFWLAADQCNQEVERRCQRSWPHSSGKTEQWVMVCAVVFQMPHCRYIYIAHLTLLNYKHLSRDVKTVYFWNRFAKTGFLPVTERPILSGIIVYGRWSLRACYQSIACCFTAAVAHIPDAGNIPDAWMPSQRNKGQWRIKAVGAEGTDVMPPWADNHSYATESARQCKNGRFSLPLQCI